MPLYNREQLVVVCALLALMLGLAAVRYLPSGDPSPEAFPRKKYVYEVAGAVPAPGIYRFESPRTLQQLLEAAGLQAAGDGPAVPNGSRVVAGAQVSVEPMSAQNRLNCFVPLRLAEAPAEDLALIPGMGMATARAIVDYRRRSGGIRSLQELRGIEGIGPKKLQRFAPFLAVEQ